MNREPSAHSMTVEPIEHVDNIAAELFKLRQWKADAVVTIGKLESERDEARADAVAARAEISRLGAVIDTTLTERDELKASLEAAEASIDMLREGLHAREAELTAVKSRRDEWRKDLHDVSTERDKVVRERNEAQYQLNICREDLATADRTVRVTKAALDAAIEAV